MGVEPQKIGGFKNPPKWMVKRMVPKAYEQMDDLGGFPIIFWVDTHIPSGNFHKSLAGKCGAQGLSRWTFPKGTMGMSFYQRVPSLKRKGKGCCLPFPS